MAVVFFKSFKGSLFIAFLPNQDVTDTNYHDYHIEFRCVWRLNPAELVSRKSGHIAIEG